MTFKCAAPLLLTGLLCLTAACERNPPAAPAQQAASALRIEGAWARATPPGAQTGAAYLTIIGGPAADRLVSVTSPAAEHVDIHETQVSPEGVMAMRPITDGLPIPAGATVVLEPGGRHLMFVGLKAPFTPGADVPVTLRFESAGERAVNLPVQTAAPGAPLSHGH